MYLRGVIQLELKPILDFIYSGQASFYQERMKDFLKTGKDLQIKEVKEVPEEEMIDIGENVAEEPYDDSISEKVVRREPWVCRRRDGCCVFLVSAGPSYRDGATVGTLRGQGTIRIRSRQPRVSS